MSRAFVKEPDADEGAPDLPERPISPHRNFVTESGFAHLEGQIAGLRDDLAKARASNDMAAIASASRDLRYWTARRASAELVASPVREGVWFGSEVTIEREDGRRQTFRITGEDEADPKHGLLSYVSPLANALIGKRKGDEFEFMGDPIIVLDVT